MFVLQMNQLQVKQLAKLSRGNPLGLFAAGSFAWLIGLISITGPRQNRHIARHLIGCRSVPKRFRIFAEAVRFEFEIWRHVAVFLPEIQMKSRAVQFSSGQ